MQRSIGLAYCAAYSEQPTLQYISIIVRVAWRECLSFANSLLDRPTVPVCRPYGSAYAPQSTVTGPNLAGGGPGA